MHACVSVTLKNIAPTVNHTWLLEDPDIRMGLTDPCACVGMPVVLQVTMFLV